ADALVADLVAHGGRVRTGTWVRRWADLPPARAVLLDLDPRQVVELVGDRMGGAAGRWYRAWARRYRFGPGACTVHCVTSDPIPWLDPEARRAGTVHVGGTFAEVAAAEAAVAGGRHARRPFTLVGQPTVVDPTRAPAGHHVVWAYCHVPHGSPVDASAAVTAQIERFAPGFRDTVTGVHVRTASRLAEENPVHVGGDIAVGVSSVLGIALRPVPRWDAYRTPAPGVYVCSSATPPGPGVHGMGGYWAAREVLRDLGARHGRLAPRHMSDRR
ncbi:MAG: phytoene desaturase family protein, partial [Kineosporiaceae bacterium]